MKSDITMTARARAERQERLFARRFRRFRRSDFWESTDALGEQNSSLRLQSLELSPEMQLGVLELSAARSSSSSFADALRTAGGF